MTNGKPWSGKTHSGKAPATLDDIWDELRMSNRLMIANLALQGMKQTDIAVVIDKVDSFVSQMFPTGTLRRLNKLSKGMSVGEDL
jgi:hypothetical protein